LKGMDAAVMAFAGAYVGAKPVRKRKKMSAKSRGKIAAAQRARWAKFRAKHKRLSDVVITVYSSDRLDFLLRRWVFMPGSALASTEGILHSNCSIRSCASASLIASEVRPQVVQKYSLVAGFHLMTRCFISLGCYRTFYPEISV